MEEAFFILETILITSELHPEQIQIKLHGSVLNIIARRLVKPRSRLWLMLLFTFKGNIHIWNEGSYSENCRLQVRTNTTPKLLTKVNVSLKTNEKSLTKVIVFQENQRGDTTKMFEVFH